MRKLVAVIVVDQDWQLCLWGIVKDNETDVRREENAFICGDNIYTTDPNSNIRYILILLL